MIHPELLEILCCPETRQPVREAPEALVESVNQAARDASLEMPAGAGRAESLNGGLIRDDGKFLYPVRNGIPIMLVEERIALPVPEKDGEALGENVEEDGDSGHHPVETGAGS
jgi:uncharacterized protein YbaR (Trm112 family)